MIFLSIGAFFGAIARYACDLGLNKRFGYFPLGTFIVNIIGSFIIGYMASLEWSHEWELLLSVGFSGAFTTFSTFMLEIISMMQQKKPLFAASYIILSIVMGIMAVFAGYFM